MFSMTTIESSTTRPMATVSPPSVMTLRVTPVLLEEHHRDEDRERDRHRRDDRRAPVAQEQQDDDDREQRAEQPLAQHARRPTR